jgi:hypothetical protein
MEIKRAAPYRPAQLWSGHGLRVSWLLAKMGDGRWTNRAPWDLATSDYFDGTPCYLAGGARALVTPSEPPFMPHRRGRAMRAPVVLVPTFGAMLGVVRSSAADVILIPEGTNSTAHDIGLADYNRNQGVRLRLRTPRGSTLPARWNCSTSR